MTDPRRAELPLAGGRPGATVRVHPILTGEMHAPHAFIERPAGVLALPQTGLQLLRRGGWDWLPIPAFLVEHPGAGPILIDTGLHPSCASGARGNMGPLAPLLYHVRMEHDQALRFALPARGVEPADVNVVVMTHLHIDHASAVSEFPGAMFLADRREWAAAVDGGERQGYHTRQFDHAFDWRLLDYGADAVESFAGFAQTIDLFGDGSVRVASTPGHTRGHQSVLLRTGHGEVLVIGDAAYTSKALSGETRPFLIEDEHLYERSLNEIRRYLEQTPTAVAIPGHDPARWADFAPLYQ
jgi:glyoxylase-like metal-dependent hydrolase (beta-lactamase superfamily II)